MSIPAYMTIEGATQGDMSGGALSEESVGTYAQEGHEDQIIVQAFRHHVPRGTNEQSGQVTSMPAMRPMEITKLIDKSSPMLHNALASGEQLMITIEWYRVAGSGEIELYSTVVLEDAILVDINTILPNALDPKTAHLPHMEILHVNPATITWTHEAGTEGTYRFGAAAG